MIDMKCQVIMLYRPAAFYLRKLKNVRISNTMAKTAEASHLNIPFFL